MVFSSTLDSLLVFVYSSSVVLSKFTDKH